MPLIIDWGEEGQTIRDQLLETHRRIMALNSHGYAHLSELQRAGKRLFHSMVVYENYPLPAEDENDLKHQHRLKAEFRGAIEKLDYPFGLIAYEQQPANIDNASLVLKLKYDGELSSREAIQGYLEKLKYILEQTLRDIDQAHHQISLLTKQEYQQIVYDWNQTDKEYPRDKTIQQLFQEQVDKTPNNIAVVYEDKQLTYRELNQQSNQLARYIIKQYQQQNLKGNKANQQTQKREADSIKTLLPKDTLIALCLDRSIEMIIGILGVLKSGGAYVPMDPNYPQDRIEYILKDTQTSYGIKPKPSQR